MTLHALLEAHPAALGTALGALVVLVVVLLLPRSERRLARGPFVLLVVYALARWAMGFVEPAAFPSKSLHFVAVFAWCVAIVRSLFVLFTSSRLRRLAGAPWPKILRDVVQAFLYFGVGLLALRAIGVEPGSLLTTSALLTAVLGLSMQETLGNLFAGLAMQGQQTLSVGDWVRFADGPEGFGEVTEINWRSTHFLTTGQVQVVVPNGVIARSVIKNYSRPTPIVRHETDLTLPYGVSPERVRSTLLAAVRGADGVLPEPEPHVLVGAFTDSGIAYAVRYFIGDYSRRDPIESGVRQRLLYALGRANLGVPFPHRTLELVKTGADSVFAFSDAAPERLETASLVERLARFDLVGKLGEKELETIASGTRPALYAPGEAIIRQGDPGHELFLLERGRVEVLVTQDERSPLRVAVLEAGAFFGEAAFLSGGERRATIVALSECEVLAISRAAFHPLLETHPGLSERLTSLVAERLDQLSQAVSDASDAVRLDAGRRSDLLISRIRQFLGS